MLQDLPAQPSLLGTRLFAQVLWVWVASCVPSPYLLSTSPGLEITLE